MLDFTIYGLNIDIDFNHDFLHSGTPLLHRCMYVIQPTMSNTKY